MYCIGSVRLHDALCVLPLYLSQVVAFTEQEEEQAQAAAVMERGRLAEKPAVLAQGPKSLLRLRPPRLMPEEHGRAGSMAARQRMDPLGRSKTVLPTPPCYV